jgi:hypothetical protein
MYTVHWIDSMGHGFRTFESAAEVAAWAEFNNRVLGTPALHMPTYDVTLTVGGPAPQPALDAIQPYFSEELYVYRQRMEQFLTGTVRPVFSMHEGAATAAIFESGLLAKPNK